MTDFVREVMSTSDSAPHVDVPWMRSILAEGRILCPECRHVRREHYPNPLELHLSEVPEGFSSMLVSPVAARGFRRAFLELFLPHLKHSVIGPCYMDGVLVPDLVTCYTARPIEIRGDAKETLPSSCKTCGNIHIRHFGDGPAYVVRSAMDGASVAQDSIGNLYVAEELALSIDWSPWPDIEFAAYEIYDRPIDGLVLPGDPQE